MSEHIVSWIALIASLAALSLHVYTWRVLKRNQVHGQDSTYDIPVNRDLTKMRELCIRISHLISQCSENRIREVLQELEEEIRYSNPVSRDASEEIDEEIMVLYTEIESSSLDEDIDNTIELCKRMKGLLRERDRICKYMK